MNVLFLSRTTLYTNPGGDTIQIINTAEGLKKLGVSVDIQLANAKIIYTSYDLIHFFNIIRPGDILFHTKESGKPYVVSTIFVDYSEYEKKASTGIKQIAFRTISADLIEYIKVLARLVVNNEKIVSPQYFLRGQKKSIQDIISNASLLLPNSENEYRRLFERYKTKQNYKVIPNGIDINLFGNLNTSIRESDLVLCVARIEPLKNQLNLIRALCNSSFRLFIIGRPSVNHKQYYDLCKKEAGPNVTFIDHTGQEKLIEYYSKAKVHVLPSWFETTGLSSLEAAAMGCNIVITDKGDAREYFEDMAYYCDPTIPETIKKAIEEAAGNPVDEKLRKKVLREYTWSITAKKTLEAYQQVLDKRL